MFEPYYSWYTEVSLRSTSKLLYINYNILSEIPEVFLNLNTKVYLITYAIRQPWKYLALKQNLCSE